jgi:hypothetical protein
MLRGTARGDQEDAPELNTSTSLKRSTDGTALHIQPADIKTEKSSEPPPRHVHKLDSTIESTDINKQIKM